MNNIDDMSKTGSEIVFTAGKITGEIILAVLRAFLNKIKKNPDKKNEYFTDLSSKQGKQKLKDLLKKDSNITLLVDNVTKEEYKLYQSEFKKMGVDFSVHKVGKDEYSIFFRAKDSDVIEKAIENAINKRSKKQEKNHTNDTEKANNKQKPNFKTEDLNKKAQEKAKEKTKEKVRENTMKTAKKL